MLKAICAYRNCKNEFRPKNEGHRFCTRECQNAYTYDVGEAA